MSKTASMNMVREFHRAFNVPIRRTPHLDRGRVALRMRLLREELKEVQDAAKLAVFLEQNHAAMADLLQELCDLQYVLDGTFLEFGLARHRARAMQEVHRANMSKLGRDGKPCKRADGKVLKGPDFVPADMLKVYRGV